MKMIFLIYCHLLVIVEERGQCGASSCQHCGVVFIGGGEGDDGGSKVGSAPNVPALLPLLPSLLTAVSLRDGANAAAQRRAGHWRGFEAPSPGAPPCSLWTVNRVVLSVAANFGVQFIFSSLKFISS